MKESSIRNPHSAMLCVACDELHEGKCIGSRDGVACQAFNQGFKSGPAGGGSVDPETGDWIAEPAPDSPALRQSAIRNPQSAIEES